jgi:hypothetical protein
MPFDHVVDLGQQFVFLFNMLVQIGSAANLDLFAIPAFPAQFPFKAFGNIGFNHNVPEKIVQSQIRMGILRKAVLTPYGTAPVRIQIPMGREGICMPGKCFFRVDFLYQNQKLKLSAKVDVELNETHILPKMKVVLVHKP